MPRRVRLRSLAAWSLTLAVLLAACDGGGAQVPDGYQQVEHPSLRLAVPGDWERTESERAGVDEGAVAYRVPDADGLPIGLDVYRAVRQSGDSYARAGSAVDAVLRDLYSAESFEPLEVRNDLEVPGSDDAYLQQLRIAAPNLGPDATARFTAVGVSVGEDEVVVVLITGPEDQVDDATIERIVDSLEVTGG